MSNADIYKIEEGATGEWVEKDNAFIDHVCNRINSLEQQKQSIIIAVGNANNAVTQANNALSSAQGQLATKTTQLENTQSQLTTAQADLATAQNQLSQEQASKKHRFVCGIATNAVVTGGEIRHTLNTNRVVSKTGISVNSSAGYIQIQRSGTWNLSFVFSFMMHKDHWAQDIIFTHGFIKKHNSQTPLAQGATRRRSKADFFGTVGVNWQGQLSAGERISVQVEYDWVTPNMTIFRDAGNKPTSSQIPSNETNGSYPFSKYGPAAIFTGIEL